MVEGVDDGGGAVAEVDDPVVGRVRVPAHFASYSRTPVTSAAAPSLGQHSRAVLADLGYSEDEVDELERGGVVVCAPGMDGEAGA